ncbi:hypothetical protein FRC04_005520 [Tulasnella sp. 424]|nr:hypothetical protein FRC04_005520 [Tulasnella sp. 424]
MFNQGGAANNAKQGASAAAGGAANRPSGGSTPPSSSVNQQAVQQQQQPHPYGYGGPHPGAQYGFSTPFNLVNAHPHQTHPLQHQPNPSVGGGNLNPAGGGGAAGNAASSLIDPMLSTLSDGGEGMSEDEENGASAGVKAGPTATGGGNNGINQHHLEDEDFHGDGSQSVSGQGGGVSLGVATAVDENGQPVKKKRRRQALSCTECKRRKIKCDRQNPCSPCTRRGEADRCRWATQEPIPDAISPFSSSEKFVTRQEYDLLHQKVLQLETIVAGLAPRAFLPGLDPLNLPMGPPPFPFGPPPHHGGPAPQHHPYPGAPGQQQPGGPQDGQFPPGAAGQAQAAQDIHQIYQQHLAYAAAAAAHNAQAQAAANAAAAAGQQPMEKAGDTQMEVDQAQPAVQQHATGGTEHTVEGQGSPPTLPETTGKLIPASPSASSKTAKTKKRKDRTEGDEGEEGNVGRSGAAAAKGRGKPRSQKQSGWDTNGSPLLPQEQAPGDAGESSTAAS